MAAKTSGDLKDPNPVWEVFKSVFKNLMLAKGLETDKYLNSISQMVTSAVQLPSDLSGELHLARQQD